MRNTMNEYCFQLHEWLNAEDRYTFCTREFVYTSIEYFNGNTKEMETRDARNVDKCFGIDLVTMIVD